MNCTLTLEIGPTLRGLILSLFMQRFNMQFPYIKGGAIHIMADTPILPANHPNLPITIDPPTAAWDSEGNPVPVSRLKMEVVSTDPSVLEPIMSGADPYTGEVVVGGPGNQEIASASILVRWSYNGAVLGFAASEEIGVTAGDPTRIEGGSVRITMPEQPTTGEPTGETSSPDTGTGTPSIETPSTGNTDGLSGNTEPTA